jgi:predicted flap endonuclease-1-like 5' DNA nuclease
VLYLTGQIVLFVLVALVLGAALAWVFLIGPVRRERGPLAGLPTQAADGATGDGETRHEDRRGLAAIDEDRLRALVDWLHRQEERDTVENAELLTRLAAAERQATESENRVSAAEHQVATAVEQAVAAQARIGQIEAELRGAATNDQAREARRLRTALAEAEGRAARFSGRLALVRTEAEESSLQVAAVTARLERRQAEWAAERAALLVRIAEAEALAGVWSGSGRVLADSDTGLDVCAGTDSVDAVGDMNGPDLFAVTAGRSAASGASRDMADAARAGVFVWGRSPVVASVGTTSPAGIDEAPLDAPERTVTLSADAQPGVSTPPPATGSIPAAGSGSRPATPRAAGRQLSKRTAPEEAALPEAGGVVGTDATSLPVTTGSGLPEAAEAVVPEVAVPGAVVAGDSESGVVVASVVPEVVGSGLPEAATVTEVVEPVSTVVAAPSRDDDGSPVGPVVPPVRDASAPESTTRAVARPEPGVAAGAEPARIPAGTVEAPVAPVAAAPMAAFVDEDTQLDEPFPMAAGLAGEPAPTAVIEAVADPASGLEWTGLAESRPSGDNLKEIVGIGPVIEARLRSLGITSFRQIAAMGDRDVERLSDRLDGFGNRILDDDWVGQAQELLVRYHHGL